jgi:secondary thiamine-phosphate synthase enzyme
MTGAIITIKTSRREEMIDITLDVEKVLTDSGAKDGVIVAFSQHTTCGLTVNENADPDVQRDMLHCLRTLVPQRGMGFRHGEENSDAHIKTTLVGTSVTVPVKDGKLQLGRWQGIFLCEFDGARERKVVVKIVAA